MQSNTLLVFPTSRAIRNYITQDNSNRLLMPLVSIDEFITKSINVEHLTYIDEEHRFLLLKESTHIKNFNKLGISNNFNDFIKQSEYIIRFFNELSAENITIDSIRKADTYEFYEEHLSILETIYKRYCSLLETYNYVDKITLPKKYSLNHTFLDKFSSITIFFEGYFTDFEFTLITQIAQIIPLHIHIQTNTYNKKSCEKFIDYGFTLQENFNYILDMSQKIILKSDIIKKNAQNIIIKGFAQRINQIGFIKKAITSMIEEGLKPNEIVLIVPDESFVQTLQLFDSETYFNYAMGKEIKTSTLYTNTFAIYNYFNEFEKKDIDYIDFLNLDKIYLDNTFKPMWNEQITSTVFTQLIDFLKSYESNKEILEKFEEECYKLQSLIFNYKDPITLKEVYKFLLQRLSTISIDDINGGVITVMGLLETRGISYKGVIIIDFNENIVPKRSIKDKFLSTNVKKHSNLPTRKDRENLQKYYYHTLCKNAQTIYVSYVNNDTNTISRFSSELFNVSIDESIYDNTYKSILYGQNKLTHFKEEILLDIDLSKLVWSATSLKTYLECKRKYYLKNIVKIKEHHFSLKPQNFEIGTIIHSVLEQFYSKYSKLDENTKNDILNDYFQSLKQQNPFMQLDFALWKKKLEHFIVNEKKEFVQKEKRVYKTEMPFAITYENIALKGVIDRIDIGKNFLEIIDYKTSRSISVDTLKTYEKTVDFQLVFYYLAMKAYILQQGLQHYDIKPYYYDLNNALLLEENILDEKILLLQEKLTELKTKTVNFEKCEDKVLCSYCSYSTICER
jgi:ATP-dependent helicase/nuclease subunit B